MQNETNSAAAKEKSSLFGADENIAAAAVGCLTLGASFVPYVSYFGWLIPLIAALIERKSAFARLCDVQMLVCSCLLSICSLVTLLLKPYADAAMKAGQGNRLIALGAVGIVMSLIYVVCLIFVLMTAYNAYKRRLFEIPTVTLLIKKLMKYSK